MQIQRGENEEVSEDKLTEVGDGQQCYLIRKTFISNAEESYKELMSYVAANNKEAIMKMMDIGSGFAGDKGEKVTVIKSGLTNLTWN